MYVYFICYCLPVSKISFFRRLPNFTVRIFGTRHHPAHSLPCKINVYITLYYLDIDKYHIQNLFFKRFIL